mmetsp:Transcript_34185/g.108659  ORF Transcript_34185/g.108659 Transcript_34185/m.108659 type:complete len:410 (-) Transcript_34185:58-1287(-)
MADEAIDVIAMACQDSSCDFKPWNFQRRAPGPEDVLIDIKYSGVCHTDLHMAANHFSKFGVKPEYPFVPGHEMAGVCVSVGSRVTKFQAGDHVGVGCMVDSCLKCKQCVAGREHKCKKPASLCAVQTFGDKDKHGRAAVWPKGSQTKGGYSTRMVVHERFAISIPKTYPLECAGPVFCSGITMYEPMMEYGAKEGTRVGIIGLGGLGGIGIRIARALGCKVTAISRGQEKKSLAETLGAESYVDSKSPEQLAGAAQSLDLTIDTIPVHHDIHPYMQLLDTGGKHIMVGLSPTMYAALLANPSRRVKASLIGGVARTEALLRLCDAAEPKIAPEVALRPVQELNRIYEMLDSGNDSGVRYVLDIQGSLSEQTFGTCTAPPPTLSKPQGLNYSTVLVEAFRLMGLPCFSRI